MGRDSVAHEPDVGGVAEPPTNAAAADEAESEPRPPANAAAARA